MELQEVKPPAGTWMLTVGNDANTELDTRCQRATSLEAVVEDPGKRRAKPPGGAKTW